MNHMPAWCLHEVGGGFVWFCCVEENKQTCAREDKERSACFSTQASWGEQVWKGTTGGAGWMMDCRHSLCCIKMSITLLQYAKPSQLLQTSLKGALVLWNRTVLVGGDRRGIRLLFPCFCLSGTGAVYCWAEDNLWVGLDLESGGAALEQNGGLHLYSVTHLEGRRQFGVVC